MFPNVVPLGFPSLCIDMLLSLFKRLCIILPTLIAASPQNTRPGSSLQTFLPASLQRDVPACAQPCLRASLVDQFPLACTGQANINCLCSRYSFGGESLGEVALGCLYASCPVVDSGATLTTAYNICLGQRDAVPPTKTVLTVVASFPLSSTSVTSSRPVLTTKLTSVATSTTPLRSTPTITSVASSTTQHQSKPADTVVVDALPSTPPATSPPSPPTSAPAASQDEGPKTMTPAQIAGLSVAAVATFIIAIGLMALSVFLRKRRERKRTLLLNEKGIETPRRRNFSTRFSRSYSSNPSPPEVSGQFSMFPTGSSSQNLVQAPAPVLKRTKTPELALGIGGLANNPPRRTNPHTGIRFVQPNLAPPKQSPSNLSSVHPLLRPGATRNTSNHSQPSLDQIGVAISAELPSQTGLKTNLSPPNQSDAGQQRRKSARRNASQRPDSVISESTVFEEDDMLQRRRSSKLLPTPPIPIPPIRSLQPSRQRQVPDVEPQNQHRQVAQQPELFLDIPVRHSRPQPKPVVPPKAASPPTVVPSLQQRQLGSPIQILTSYDAFKPAPNPGYATETSSGDILDYYFTAHYTKQPTPGTSPDPLRRPFKSPRSFNVKSKPSSSNMSRATSRASRGSTNIRDSTSSQTSFETVDSYDPTPEDEDEDKQLSDVNRLSPVAESPISNLRYPKVPRASNQLVRRSPRNSQGSVQDSPRGFPEPPTLLVKRRGEREALQLEKCLNMASPNTVEPAGQVGNYRQHLRSSSVESWSSNSRMSDRGARAQSGQWPKSPLMYELDVVRPLDVRSRQQGEQPVDITALKSPAWVPRLTPTRQGDDLLISVTYSKPGR